MVRRLISCAISLILGLLSYILLSSIGRQHSAILVPLDKVIVEYLRWYSSGRLLDDVGASVFRVCSGFLIGVTTAIIVASLFTLNRRVYFLINPLLEFFRVISPLAWIPFAILLFGIGDRPAIFLVSIAAFFPTFTATHSAIQNISKSHIEVSLQFRASFLQQLKYLYYPSCMPEVFAGMRSSLGIAWYVVIAAEMLGAQNGLGYEIQMSSLSLQMERVIASIGVIGLIGLILGMFMQSVEARVTRWKDKEYESYAG